MESKPKCNPNCLYYSLNYKQIYSDDYEVDENEIKHLKSIDAFCNFDNSPITNWDKICARGKNLII